MEDKSSRVSRLLDHPATRVFLSFAWPVIVTAAGMWIDAVLREKRPMMVDWRSVIIIACAVALSAIGMYLIQRPRRALMERKIGQEREQVQREQRRLAEQEQDIRKRKNELLLTVKPLALLLDSCVVFSFYSVFSKVVQQWNRQHPEQQITHAQERFLWPLQLVLGHLRRISGIDLNTTEHLQGDLFFICHDTQGIAQHFFAELQSKHATATNWPAALHEDYTKLRETWNELLGGWNRYCDQRGIDTCLVERMPEIGSIGVPD